MKYLQLTALICLCLAAVSLTADVMQHPLPPQPFITEQNNSPIPDNRIWLTPEEALEIKTVIQDALKMINKQKQEIDHLKNITGCS